MKLLNQNLELGGGSFNYLFSFLRRCGERVAHHASPLLGVPPPFGKCSPPRHELFHFVREGIGKVPVGEHPLAENQVRSEMKLHRGLPLTSVSHVTSVGSREHLHLLEDQFPPAESQEENILLRELGLNRP